MYLHVETHYRGSCTTYCGFGSILRHVSLDTEFETSKLYSFGAIGIYIPAMSQRAAHRTILLHMLALVWSASSTGLDHP